ncbi:MAG: HlyD family secretion protein [Bryobacteraceae bacterium]|nr:HlyD family secretion protein [Bryobacteraceae bacterium]
MTVLAEESLLPGIRLAGSTKPARILSAILMAFLIVSALVLVFAPWVQNVAGTGRVIALTPVERQQTIGAPVEGRIVKWTVIEGSRVKAGELIAEIADNDPEILRRLYEERDAVVLRLEQAKSRATSLESRVEQIDMFRRNELQVGQNRLSAAVENVKAAEQVIKAAEASLTAAQQNIDRQRALLQKGLVAVRSVELAQQDFARAQAEVDRAKAGLGSALNEKLARDSELLRIESDFRSRLDDARASLATARADIANANAELQRTEVRVSRQTRQQVVAPRDGVILRLLAQPGGEFLKSGDPVALFVPESASLVVELLMDGNDIPLIHAGDAVRLQFEGWPAIQFSGWPSVAVGTFGGRVTLVDSTDNGQGKFRILVQPDPKDEPWPDGRYLRQGARANGWVLLNQVSLGFELWRQFNGFPPTVTPPTEAAGSKKK